MPPLYETSLSNEAWEVVSSFFVTESSVGRPRKHDFRLLVDAIFYIVKTGCPWRCLPNDFPPWKTVYNYFRFWSLSDRWRLLNDALVAIARVCAGKENSPSLVSIDS